MEEEIKPQNLTKDTFFFYLKSNWFPEEEPEEFFSKTPKKLRKDKEVVKLAMHKLHCRCFIHADEELQYDKDLIMFGIMNDQEFFGLIPEKLQKDEEFVSYIAKNYGGYDYFPLEMQMNPSIVIEASKNGSFINEIPEKVASNKDLILETLNYSTIFYQKASDDLKNDFDVVKKAISIEPYSFESSSTKCKSDKDLCKEALYKNGNLLKYVAEELRDDKELVRIAVRQSGSSLEYAGTKLKNDKEIVMLSLSEYSNSLAFVSKELLMDKDVAILALENDKYSEERDFIAMEYLTEFQNDKEFMMFAIKQNSNSFIFASDTLKKDKEVVKIAVGFDGRLLKEAEHFQNDFDIVKIAVSNYGLALQFASNELKENKEIVMSALLQNGNALEFAVKFQDDFEVVLFATQSSGESLKFASEKLKKNYRLICSAVNENGCYLNNIPIEDKVYKKKELIHNAIRKGCDISFLAQIPNNRDYYLTAVKKNGNTIISQENEEIFYDQEIMSIGLKSCPNLFFKLGQSLVMEKKLIFDYLDLTNSLGHLPYQLLSDEEIIMKALKNPSNFNWISEEKRKDKKFILNILKKYKNPEILLNINFELLYDRDFLKYCAIIQGSCLTYFPSKYQDDKELVKIAIRNTSYSIFLASKRLQNDIELVEMSFQDDPANLMCCSDRNVQYEILSKKCKISKNFYEKGQEILELMNIEPEFYNLASNELVYNPKFFDEALKISNKFVHSLNMNKSVSKENLLKIIANRATSIYLDLFPVKMLKDRDVIHSFLTNHYEEFIYSDVLKYFKNDKELIEYALSILIKNHPLPDKETVKEYFKSFDESNIFSRGQFDWFTTDMLKSREIWMILKRIYTIPFHKTLESSMIHFEFQ